MQCREEDLEQDPTSTMQQKVEVFTALFRMYDMPSQPEAMDMTDYRHHIDQLREKEFPSMMGRIAAFLSLLC